MNMYEWESDVYPKLCAEARRSGQIARESGLPRVCNCKAPNGEITRVFQKQWLEGYDGIDPNRQLEEFVKVENCLATLPLRHLTPADLDDNTA